MNTKFLEDLGLSNTESNVYLALLELGSVTANKIAERSGIHRRTVYDVLEILIEKGLVSFIVESNRKYYQAETPERFLDILKEKEKELKKVLPDLLEKRKLSKELQEVTVYRGKKGLKNIYELMLKTRQTINIFGSSGKFKEVLGEIFYKQWMKRFAKSKCKIKIILSKKSKGKGKYPKKMEVKYILEEFILPSSTSIWEDYIFIEVFSEKPFGILIRSKEIVNSYLKYFNLLWKIAKK